MVAQQVSGNSSPSVVAFIPARSGSERIRDKNINLLGGHPALAYSIAAACDSDVFDAVIVSTDSEHYADIARHYGAEVPFLRPGAIAGSKSPDIEWVVHALETLAASGRSFDCFSILRPTSPLRQAGTIRRAWSAFSMETGIDSLRAVELCQQHPGKMWVVRGNRLLPILPYSFAEAPWHSSQYKALPEIYVQNASLEIAWSHVALEKNSIAGDIIMPFLTENHEGADVNTPQDWFLVEHLIATGEAMLPKIEHEPFASALS
jgi:CMP-N,N'-diacetyllegionaminic acid synthase